MDDANENALFQTMDDAIQKNDAVYSEFLQALPSPHTLAVRLDDRIACTLSLENDHAVLAASDASMKNSADLEVILFSESIRRLSSQRFDDLTSMLTSFGSLVVQGHVRVRALCSLAELHKKGYLLTIQRLGAAPAHLILEMLSHRFNLLQPLLIIPTELFLKKLRDLVQK